MTNQLTAQDNTGAFGFCFWLSVCMTPCVLGACTGSTTTEPATSMPRGDAAFLLDARLPVDGMMDAQLDGRHGSLDVGRDANEVVGEQDSAPQDVTVDTDVLVQDTGDFLVVDGLLDSMVAPPDMAGVIPIEGRCNDDIDNDGDQRIDCEDPDCRGAGACFDLRETCDDGRDNNGDNRVDCDDVTCHLEPGCPAPDVEAFTTEQVEARFFVDCVPCHGPPQPEVQLDLTAPFLDLIVGVPAFEVDLVYIKAGDAAQSWIYHKIRYRQLDFMGDGDGMPPEHTWTAQDVERLGLWIDNLPQH